MIHSRWTLAMPVALVAVVALEAAQPAAGADKPLSPRPWVIASPSALRPGAPPDAAATRSELAEVQAAVRARDAQALARIAHWNAGWPGYPWQAVVKESMAKEPSSSPSHLAVFRPLALLSVAIQDATLAAFDAKKARGRPRPVDLDPTLATAVPSPAWPSYPSEHAAVAAALINRAKSDGSDQPWTGTVPKGPGVWAGTNPRLVTASAWRPWLIPSADALRPGPPPAWDSPQLAAELAELKGQKLTFPMKLAAFRWNAPEVFEWMAIANTKIFEQRLDDNPPFRHGFTRSCRLR